MALASKPNFKALEPKWQKFWLTKNIYKFDPHSKKPIYSIDTPPPTTSGKIHLGHAFHYTQFEFMARYKRMAGYNVFFPIGFDDNGHPTERFVENKRNIDSTKMTRKEFNKIVLEELSPAEEAMKSDLLRLGHSYDWTLFYRTISPYCIKTAQLSFLDLYKKGLTYRAEEPTIWCPSCQTALSQADVEDEERESTLNYIYFKLKNGRTLTIATSRPELLPACVGIFVNPADKRYQNLIGKTAIVPLFDYEVPIMSDEKVDPDFGTGIVMICTFGDKTDIEWWRKYKLPLKIIISKDGKLNKLAGKYAGLTFAEAKEQILADLEHRGLLAKKEPLKQTVGTCWRCHTPVEFLVTKQWFIKLLENKDKFLELGKRIKWHPDYYFSRYKDWISNLGWDWLISRQRHFGVPIPVWYCAKCGETILPEEADLPVDPETDLPKKACKCGSKKFVPEKDVFDTWMTSSLTPQIALGWANKDKLFSKLFPEDLRASAHDIIRSWEFYTIVKAWYHSKQIPWKHVLISGHALDPKGKAMHKSLGNIIEPMTLVDKYGADALRYWAATANMGEDVPVQEKEFVRAQKLMIKLWNVARFVELWKVKPKKTKSANFIDNWINSRLSEVIKSYRESFEAYDPIAARRLLENFFWHEYCDFYIEMIKHRLYGDDLKDKQVAEQVLYSTFYKLLQMFAVFLPHLTEEIYQELFVNKIAKEKSLHLTQLPEYSPVDTEALELGALAVEIVAEIRKYKASKKMSLGASIDALTVAHPKPKEAEKVLDEVAKITRIKDLHVKKGALGVST